jgi:hypothetical protein
VGRQPPGLSPPVTRVNGVRFPQKADAGPPPAGRFFALWADADQDLAAIADAP